MKQREAEVERLRDRVNDDDSIKESLRERVTQLTEELSDAATGGEEAALREKMQQRLAGELAAAFTELQVRWVFGWNCRKCLLTGDGFRIDLTLANTGSVLQKSSHLKINIFDHYKCFCNNSAYFIILLQGLVQICNDEVEGKDPNMSVLLGLRPTGAAAEESEGLDAAARLAQAKALRKEVDRLRSLVSNKIAENMGDNLDCSQQ